MTKHKTISKEQFIERFHAINFTNSDLSDLYYLLTIISEKDLIDWTKALSSGNYQQTQSNLYDGHGYCCLGVICHLHGSTNDQLIGKAMPHNIHAVEDDYFNQFKDDIDYKDDCLGVLASMNDQGLTFKEIANIINIYQDDKA